MKEINFREKSKFDGTWCYGIPVYTKFGCDYMINNTVSPDFYNSCLTFPMGSAVPCDEKTRGSETCFTDSKGVVIFDGDIISDPKDSEYNNKHLVSFSEKDGYFHVILLPFRKGHACDGPLTQGWIDDFKKEIIGNKFDNPELLNGKK